MTANEVATLVTEATPFVTAAAGAYGHAVLSKAQDKAADATVGVGARILRRVFGSRSEGAPLPEQVADVVDHRGDEEYLVALKVAIRKALERDEAMLADVRSILADAPGTTTITQNVIAGRDAYAAGRDMTIHQRPR